MSDLILNQYRQQFHAIRHFEDGVEFWDARELMQVLGYKKWERFAGAMARAEISCQVFGGVWEDNVSRIWEVRCSQATDCRCSALLRRFQL